MKFLVEQILNLPDIKVLDFQELEGEEIIITIEKSVNYSTCPWCGQITHSIHQNHWRIIHDLPWNKKPVLLKINPEVLNVKKKPRKIAQNMLILG